MLAPGVILAQPVAEVPLAALRDVELVASKFTNKPVVRIVP
jgi:hypothetical protein